MWPFLFVFLSDCRYTAISGYCRKSKQVSRIEDIEEILELPALPSMIIIQRKQICYRKEFYIATGEPEPDYCQRKSDKLMILHQIEDDNSYHSEGTVITCDELFCNDHYQDDKEYRYGKKEIPFLFAYFLLSDPFSKEIQSPDGKHTQKKCKTYIVVIPLKDPAIEGQIKGNL